MVKPKGRLGTVAMATITALVAVSFASVTAASAISNSKDTVTAIPALTGVGTTLALNPSTVQTLTGLGVKLAPFGTATVSGSDITFPITSGYVEIHSNHDHKPGYIEGSIEHYGSGVTLSAGTTTVTLSDFVVTPATPGSTALSTARRTPHRCCSSTGAR